MNNVHTIFNPILDSICPPRETLYVGEEVLLTPVKVKILRFEKSSSGVDMAVCTADGHTAGGKHTVEFFRVKASRLIKRKGE